MIYSISRLLSLLLCKILFRIKVFGAHNLPRKGSFILASNHKSYLDPVLLGVSCRRQLNYMARHDLFNNPFFSWYLSKIRVFPVKRDKPDFFALREAMRRVRNGGGLVIFPEGRRVEKFGIENPQPGVGFLVNKLKVPVIPAFIRGSDEAWPKGAKFIRMRHISVHFGKIISLGRRLPNQEMADEIMRGIKSLSCAI